MTPNQSDAKYENKNTRWTGVKRRPPPGGCLQALRYTTIHPAKWAAILSAPEW